MYDIASLHRAVSVEDALRALAANENALVISGGTDVLVQNREGRHAGASLVSIHGLEEIRGVSLLENGDTEQYVAVNGRSFLIRRGEEVEVPECVAEVLRLSEKQKRAAYLYQQEAIRQSMQGGNM